MRLIWTLGLVLCLSTAGCIESPASSDDAGTGNAAGGDGDGDGDGDTGDGDGDGDGDTGDGDGDGDTTDRDGDGVADTDDNCPDDDNADQADVDTDGVGDACDACTDADGAAMGDVDCDGVADEDDNCPGTPNGNQLDTDEDGVGDACDGDDDEDGVGDDDDCDPLDEQVLGCRQYYLDVDGDGFGNPRSSKCLCESSDNYRAVAFGDCDDADIDIRPGATEACDGVDSDCSGLADDGFPDLDNDGMADCVDPDRDGDGVLDGDDNCPGTPNPEQVDSDSAEVDDGGDACDADGDVDNDGVPDGEDNCPTVKNPGQEVMGEGVPVACADDLDGDGYNNAVDNCPNEANPSQADLDEDDIGDACDEDDDDDGEPDESDCAPRDGDIHPGASEVCGDAVDNDCSGADGDGTDADGCTDYYLDADNDGFGDYNAPAICFCAPSGLYTTVETGDCDDGNEDVYKGAEEFCNGLDDNCNGTADELWDTLGQSCDGPSDADECADGAIVCDEKGTGVVCSDGPLTPMAEEVCNGADDDCDGAVDEEFPKLGAACDGKSENGGDADECEDGVRVCNASGSGLVCNDDALSIVEICDDEDNDCDGSTDEKCDDDGDGYCDDGMEVSGTPKICPKSSGGEEDSYDCDDALASISPEGTEVCNERDDDCDGAVDEAGSYPVRKDEADELTPRASLTPGTGSFEDDNAHYEGFFAGPKDTDYLVWSSSKYGGRTWACQVGLDAGVKVRLNLAYFTNKDANPKTSQVSGVIGNKGSFSIPVSNLLLPGSTYHMVAGIEPVEVSACFAKYTLSCDWSGGIIRQ